MVLLLPSVRRFRRIASATATRPHTLSHISRPPFLARHSCVDLLERKPVGILPLLDEICFLGREATTDAEVRGRL